MYTPAAEAARRIADAILDDATPLRAGCDDMSEGMLTAWRNAESDEAWMRPISLVVAVRRARRRDASEG